MEEKEKQGADFVEIHLIARNKYGRIETKKIIYFTLILNWTSLLQNYDFSLPFSQLLNNYIITITTDKQTARILQGKRRSHKVFNCGYCGAALGPQGCKYCHFRFRSLKIPGYWNAPLPPKAVDLLKKEGYVFSIDPQEAQAKEIKEWRKFQKKLQNLLLSFYLF